MLMPLIRFLTVALAVFLPFLEEAQAGVTIHYEGRAESAAAVDGALRMLTSRAHALGWKVDDASAEDVSLTIMVVGTTPGDERDFGVEGSG